MASNVLKKKHTLIRPENCRPLFTVFQINSDVTSVFLQAVAESKTEHIYSASLLSKIHLKSRNVQRKENRTEQCLCKELNTLLPFYLEKRASKAWPVASSLFL